MVTFEQVRIDHKRLWTVLVRADFKMNRQLYRDLEQHLRNINAVMYHNTDIIARLISGIDWKNNEQEVGKLREQNKILRELFESLEDKVAA